MIVNWFKEPVECDKAVKDNATKTITLYKDGVAVASLQGGDGFDTLKLPDGEQFEIKKREPTNAELMDAILELAAAMEG